MTAAARERVHTFLVMKQAGKPDRILVWDTQDVSVGRSSENDISLDEGELSRRHAIFSRVGDVYRVKDLGTSNGTFVNGERVAARELSNKDVVRAAELEFVFYRVARNPAALGHKVEYTSQLKQFGGPQGSIGDGEATILGLVEPVASADEDEFDVRPANEFAYDLHGMKAPPARPRETRNLDLELEPVGLADLDMPPEPEAAAGEPAWTLDEAKPQTLSVHLEVEGLSGELRRSVEALFGKVIRLPSLRIRLKSDDLG